MDRLNYFQSSAQFYQKSRRDIYRYVYLYTYTPTWKRTTICRNWQTNDTRRVSDSIASTQLPCVWLSPLQFGTIQASFADLLFICIVQFTRKLVSNLRKKCTRNILNWAMCRFWIPLLNISPFFGFLGIFPACSQSSSQLQQRWTANAAANLQPAVTIPTEQGVPTVPPAAGAEDAPATGVPTAQKLPKQCSYSHCNALPADRRKSLAS